jgi:hypothetical protein
MCQRTTPLKCTGDTKETIHALQTSALNTGEWSASCSRRIMPGKAKQIKILNMAFYEGMYV